MGPPDAMQVAVSHRRELDADALDYQLPRELIAQHPVEPRDHSRLMVVDRTSGSVRHYAFRDLPNFLDERDLLVANDSRVLPARVQARKPSGGRVEILVLPPASGTRVAALAKSSKPLRVAHALTLDDGRRVSVASLEGDGRCVLELSDGDWNEVLERVGKVPLPPYIRHGREEPGDRERYQTVYARQPGSVAAPTAGLHFTFEVLERMRERGVRFATLTLHVGPATFAPVRTTLAEHVMSAEWISLSRGLAREVESTQRRGGRVTAIGTTTVRALESAADPLHPGTVRPLAGETELFIRPGFRFSVCDHLLTNFHLPRTTLLSLVMAFGGDGLIRHAYEQAVRERYRFYSYGDAMLVL